MNHPEVSVIIPVYQVRPYLARCLDSLLHQTMKDIELICIDDESTDGGLDLLRSYAAQDSRIRVIENPHLGISAARNAGLDAARGDYVVFVDSDDYVDENMLARLMETARREHADCVICSYHDVMEGDEPPPQAAETEQPAKTFSPQEMETISCSVWNKLIRRSVIEEFQLRFPLNVHYGEDTAFNYCLLPHCSRISSIGDRLYYYIQRRGSLTGKASIHAMGMLDASMNVLDHYKRFNVDPSFRLKWLELLVHSLKRIRSHAPHRQQAAATARIRDLLLAFDPQKDELETLSLKSAQRLRRIMEGKSDLNASYYWRKVTRRIRGQFKRSH